MNMILLDPAEVDARGVARLADYRAKHLIEVLKVRPEQVVRIGLLDGPHGEGRVSRVEGNLVEMACSFEGEPPPVPQVDLLLALPRPKVMKRLWAQLAALGVGRIMLTNAEKVERNYFDTHVLEEAFYRPLLIEGLQQARDTRVPQVSVHRQFRKLVESDLADRSDGSVRWVAHPGSHASPLDTRHSTRCLLAIGPEGGWNDFEMALLEQHGFARVGMSARTLRTDTACIALLALVHNTLRADHSEARSP
ncbi:MAG TPA: RsmE family RNA methyltransferase [Kiritimatiellia bacterium]|jgi:RsmE family RNA methyltransferase